MIKNIILLVTLSLSSHNVFALNANDFTVQANSPLSITGTNLGKKRGLDISIPGEFRDAFGRLRVSEQLALFYSTNIYYNTETMFNLTSGAGAAIAHLPDEAAVSLTVGTPNGERAVRQSAIYVPYIPGKSQLVALTGVLGASKTNNVRRIGLYDDSNGLFFEMNSAGISIGVRSSASGSVVDTKVAQADWNIDKLNLQGTFTKTVDFTKTQIFIIDYQWLGVGRVRFGLDLDGEVVYVHEAIHANNQDKVYMAQGTLPVRYENVNTGITASPTVLKEICAAVASEGAYAPPVLEFSASSATTADVVTVRELVGAIRLKSSFGGKTNRKSAFLQGFAPLVTDEVLVEVVKCNTPSAITGTWVSAGASSAVEYSLDISAVTCATTQAVESFWIPASTNRGAADCTNCTLYTNPNRLIAQDIAGTNSQIMLFYATSQAGSANVFPVFRWLEYF
jgi:hypothetical protein